MITREEVERIRHQLLAVLEEDAHNADRLQARLDAIGRESGIGAHAALLLILTHLRFEEGEARRHWEAILAHRGRMAETLGRDVGVRVAMIDYFMNVNRRLVRPTLIDLHLQEGGGGSPPVDALTGLATDRTFRAAVQNEMRRARRYRQKLAVALFDLDGFARINEAAGSMVADRLLKETAILLHNKVRDIDLAGRPGEDEMGLVLPETDRNGALLVAERFRGEVESHFHHREVGGRPAGLTVSGGVACYPDDASTPDQLIEHAAKALYRAKAAGKNTVHVYHPERRRFLRVDLDAGRFEVEVLAPHAFEGRARNLSRNGVLFGSVEPLHVGEEIEIRLVSGAGEPAGPSPRIRGRVVRLEELPDPAPEDVPLGEPASLPADRFEIGMAFDLDWAEGEQDLAEFFDRAQLGKVGSRP